MFLVVDKAPANLVNPRTGNVVAVFPETGIYFLYGTNDQGIVHTSSLVLSPKSVNVPIPGELTNIVGGYVGVEKKEPLIDAVVPASSFELYTTPSKTYYEAPITLGFTPADGDLIRGTINGVEINGQWIGISKYAMLYREGNTDVQLCVIGFHGEEVVISLQQDSAPTTDYELHLYRYVPASIVKIPQEYVEGLEETTANANQAFEAATAAQSTATEITNVVQPADTHNNGIKIKRYIGFKDVLDQYSSPVISSDIKGCIYLRKSSSKTGVNLVIDNGDGAGTGGEGASIGSDGLMLSKNSKIYAPVTPSSYGPIISIYNDDYRAYVEFIKDACLVLPSSTPNSTKKFKITIGDDARPTFTDISNPNNTWTPGDNLPTVTASDKGKFLRVSENGEWIADVLKPIVIEAETNMSNGTVNLTADGISKMNTLDSKYENGNPCPAYLHYAVNGENVYTALIFSQFRNYYFRNDYTVSIYVTPDTENGWKLITEPKT